MKYLYIVLGIVAAQLLFVKASAFENTTYIAAKPAPEVVEIPVAVPTAAAVKPDTKRLEREPVKIVQDTVLPPCDIIFFKSGKLEYCKIIQTDPATISYKMCDYPDGPTIIVNKSTVKKIRYANGREEIITSQEPTFDTSTSFNKPHRDPVAIWALISSLSGLLFPLGAIAGVILGFISLGRIRKANGELTGRGSAKAGIIIGLILIALIVLSL